MARRGKQFTPLQQRQAQKHERDRLEAITGVTEQLTCLDRFAGQVADDCALHVDRHEFDLAIAGLAIEFWADQPVAKDVVAMIAAVQAEHQRHCDAMTAFGTQLAALVDNLGAQGHVHLRPLEPYRQRVEACLYPPVTPPR
jgi:hypothetical protein